MKILVDFASHGSLYSGVSKYSLNILLGFHRLGIRDIVILASPAVYDQLKNLFPEYQCIISEYKQGAFLSNVLKLSRQVNEIDCDLVFATVPGKYFLWCKKPIVQTIHDLQFFLLPFSIRKIMTMILTPIILFKSQRIITISDFVKNDLCDHYKFIRPNKVKRIYNSVNIQSSDKGKQNGDYILYVSRLEKTKNTLTLLKAFHLIKDETDVKLKLVGKETPYWRNVLLPYISANNLHNKIELLNESYSEKELIELYENSSVFVHPSIAEGFGYTPIEAAILKVPVITTKCTSIYETTLGLLNYCQNPFDENELATRILTILKSPPSIQQLEEISHKLSITYNVENLSLEIYKYFEEQWEK